MSKKETKKPAGSKKNGFGATLARWFNRALFPNKELDIYAEEQLESPTRLVVKNFFAKPLSVIALVLFVIIALFVFIAPNFVTLDLSEQDSTLVNCAPGYSMMKYDKALVGDLVDLSVGANFAAGVDSDGNVYVWGHTRITKTRDVADIPEKVQQAKIVKIAAGNDHIVALGDDGTLYCWGNDRLGQCDIPDEIDTNSRLHTFDIVKLYASNQFSAVVTSDHRLILWGNEGFSDIKYNAEMFDGHVVDVALTNSTYIVLLDDGSVQYAGFKSANAVTSSIPSSVSSGVVSISATSNTAAAVKRDGSVVVWGNATKGEKDVPEFTGKVVSVAGGRFHYTALLEDGTVVSWGSDKYKQTDVPDYVATSGNIKAVYSGFFQNYAVDNEGKIYTWGLKGFFLGTDDLGRDVFVRIVNGGKMTMTIGALSVVISTIIGILLGGLAGYFGGVVDMVIMRITEIVSCLPFIPFAMILSAVLGTMVSIQQRMYIIMVILGVLSWPGLCEQVRAQMFAQREMEYVTAAKTIGVKESKIIFKHIIPNVMSVVLVTITLAFGTAMLTESTLSYLGFGIPLPTPTWGNMLTNANNSIVIQNYWWNWVFVALIFGVTCICINLIGDGLRDALDPKSNER